jgi:hypothetical protein
MNPGTKIIDPAHTNPFILLTMLCVSPASEESPALRRFAVDIARQCLDLANTKPSTQAEAVFTEAIRAAEAGEVDTASLPHLAQRFEASINLQNSDSAAVAAERFAYQAVTAVALPMPLEAAYNSLQHAICLHIVSDLPYDDFLVQAATTLSELIGDPFASNSADIVSRIRAFAVNAVPVSLFSAPLQNRTTI